MNELWPTPLEEKHFDGRGLCTCRQRISLTALLRDFTEHETRNTQLHYTDGSGHATFSEGRVTSSDNFDLIVIGCGPAGEKAGAQAAYFGKRVAVIERAEHMGGSCINTGTVPSKTLRESALYFSGLKQRGLYGI